MPEGRAGRERLPPGRGMERRRPSRSHAVARMLAIAAARSVGTTGTWAATRVASAWRSAPSCGSPRIAGAFPCPMPSVRIPRPAARAASCGVFCRRVPHPVGIFAGSSRGVDFEVALLARPALLVPCPHGRNGGGRIWVDEGSASCLPGILRAGRTAPRPRPLPAPGPGQRRAPMLSRGDLGTSPPGLSAPASLCGRRRLAVRLIADRPADPRQALARAGVAWLRADRGRAPPRRGREPIARPSAPEGTASRARAHRSIRQSTLACPSQNPGGPAIPRSDGSGHGRTDSAGHVREG